MPTTKFSDLTPPPDASRRQTRAELEQQLARYVGGLTDLRHRVGLTQTDVAAELEVSQAQVSRIENGTDALVSSIARYVDALGGELVLAARIAGDELVFDLGAPSGPAGRDASLDHTAAVVAAAEGLTKNVTEITRLATESAGALTSRAAEATGALTTAASGSARRATPKKHAKKRVAAKRSSRH
jgi:transcriptional regulator with XRE-family HTH domain